MVGVRHPASDLPCPLGGVGDIFHDSRVHLFIIVIASPIHGDKKLHELLTALDSYRSSLVWSFARNLMVITILPHHVEPLFSPRTNGCDFVAFEIGCSCSRPPTARVLCGNESPCTFVTRGRVMRTEHVRDRVRTDEHLPNETGMRNNVAGRRILLDQIRQRVGCASHRSHGAGDRVSNVYLRTPMEFRKPAQFRFRFRIPEALQDRKQLLVDLVERGGDVFCVSHALILPSPGNRLSRLRPRHADAAPKPMPSSRSPTTTASPRSKHSSKPGSSPSRTHESPSPRSHSASTTTPCSCASCSIGSMECPLPLRASRR